MTVIDQAAYVYAIGGSDCNDQETLNDVWRSVTSLHNIAVLQDQCHLPALRSGCASYGLLCIPPSLNGGFSTLIQQSNGSIVVSCAACPLATSGSQVSSTAYIAAIVAAVAFAFAFAAAITYLYVLRIRATAAGHSGLLGGSQVGADTAHAPFEPLSQPTESDQSNSSYHNL